MNLYTRVSAASKGLYDLSKASTDKHMADEKSDINAAWVQSQDEITLLNSNFMASADSTHKAFDEQRATDHTEMLADMLANILGPVTAEVAALVLSDESLDAQLAKANTDNAAAWAKIGSDEGTVAVDFILA